MSDVTVEYDGTFVEALSDVRRLNLESDEATAAIKNLRTLSECRPPKSEPEPAVAPEPKTFWARLKAHSAGVWDNETTRVLIKAGGAFAGVALVTWTTVHRDHVVTREALNQANLRNS